MRLGLIPDIFICLLELYIFYIIFLLYHKVDNTGGHLRNIFCIFLFQFVDYKADIVEIDYALAGIRLNIEGFNGHNNDINFGFVFPLISGSRGSNLIFYGQPKAFPNYFNIVTAFPSTIWSILCLVTLTFIVLFCAILKVYRDLLGHDELVRKGTKEIDIVFKIISTLTEPETFNMFPVWSTGKKISVLSLKIKSEKLFSYY